MANEYRDNIPTTVVTTIDPDLHSYNRAQHGRLAVVVDYLWTTASYRVGTVEIKSGVSDHCAVVCSVTKI